MAFGTSACASENAKPFVVVVFIDSSIKQSPIKVVMPARGGQKTKGKIKSTNVPP